MKKADVKVGGTYAAKVTGKVVPVRIDAESAHGGWTGTNQATGKQVRIKSARRLRGPWKRPQGAKKRKGETKGKKERKDAPRAKRGREGAKRASLLDLAAEVLAKASEPMNTKAIVEKVLATGRWQTKGKTPAATLYSAIIREIANKGDDARFEKVERGKFQLAK